LPPDCEAQVITSQKDALEIGPELLKNKALRTMKQLVKFSTSRAIKEQLSQDSKRSAKKMQKYILEAMVSLEQLPDIQVVCSSEQYCVLVDNSGPIKQHIQALSKLRNQIIRALNRGTRLAYPTFEQAQVATKKYGREVKRYTKGLITKANALPQVRFQCS
jgi:hypothetical protein